MAGALERVTTGIEGLDVVLKGGLLQGGAYIVQGRPGAGKTTLANQICFHHAARRGCALYVTLLAEAHARLLQNLATFEFFDPSLVPSSVYYVSGTRALETDGLDGLVRLLREEMRLRNATLLVLDGLLNVRESAASNLDLKRFVQELQTHAAFAGCTVLLLTSTVLEETSPEHTMVDGVFELSDQVKGVRSVRHLIVRKLRGTAHLRGMHLFDITDAGIVVYPRLESQYGLPSRDDMRETGRMPSGLDRLDEAIGHGLPTRTVTLLAGASGTGKTTLGLHFLSRSTVDEPGLHFGFYETPNRLLAKADALGIGLDTLVAKGAVEIAWQPSTENFLDELGHRLLTLVQRQGTRRLFLDGVGAFQRAAIAPERFVAYMSALSNELRSRGVTSMVTWEQSQLFGTHVDVPSPEISSIVENLILLRFTEWRAEVHRLLSILKIRDSIFDPKLRTFRIGSKGIELEASPAMAEAQLSGYSHAAPMVPPEPHPS